MANVEFKTASSKEDPEAIAYRNKRRRCRVYVVLLVVVIVSLTALSIALLNGPRNQLKSNLPGRQYVYSPIDCNQDLQWWQTSIIYQIYPRSFQDSNNDGIGDLKGIEQRLSHFENIHVGAVWLSPMFKSPMKDFGYDVSDYKDIDPIFGNMNDFDSLLAAMQKKNIKLILDFVPNHSSDQHAWFIESRSSRDNPKRDWYMWAEPKGYNNGKPIPPNNWISVFSGSMWQYDNRTNQFYLHQFLVEQPDLNYTNPEVVEASRDILRFWLGKGVDGFRIDAIKHVYENPKLPDEVPDPNYRPGVDPPYSSLIHNETTDFPPLHWLNRQWRLVFDEYSKTKPRFAVGEAYDPIDIIMKYYGSQQQPEFHFPFNFFLLTLPTWTGRTVNETVDTWMSKMPACGWPNWVVGNHDNHRIYNRRGAEYVKAVNAINLLLPGTPTTYYGEEINMRNVKISLADTQDPFGLQNPDIYETVSRDPERTPMQWDASPNAGFSAAGVKTWLPISPDFKTVNVESENADPLSHLAFYRNLSLLRQSSPAWRYPNYQSVLADDDIYAFLRFHQADAHAYLVTANLGSANITRDLSSVSDLASIQLSSNPALMGRTVRLHDVSMSPGEVIVYKINQAGGGH